MTLFTRIIVARPAQVAYTYHVSDPLFDHSQADINRGPLDDPRILSGPYWSELRVFLAVAKTKSFNKAGAALSMSRNKVSRAIQHLQDTMGAVLLVSSNSGIQLTDKGKELASKLISVDQMLYSMSNDLKAEAREAEGLVRVTATEAMTGFLLFQTTFLSATNIQRYSPGLAPR